MRTTLFALGMLLGSISAANAQLSVGIGMPGVSIGINVPAYPQLVAVPGYPVYYAPRVNSNYFFYDGMYWVYQQDNWYASSWYNGPWALVYPESVPLYVLRVPVRYYRQPPVYFNGWGRDAPPRWGEHWGNSWEQNHRGWDNWNRSSAPPPAPLPVYQRQYSGNRYPPAAQQQMLQGQNYRYQPHEAVVQQHYQAQQAQVPPMQAAPPPQRAAPAARAQPPQHAAEPIQRPAAAPAPPPQRATQAPRPQPPQQQAAEPVHRTAPTSAPTQARPQPAPVAPHEQAASKPPPDRGSARAPKPDHEKEGQQGGERATK